MNIMSIIKYFNDIPTTSPEISKKLIINITNTSNILITVNLFGKFIYALSISTIFYIKK